MRHSFQHDSKPNFNLKEFAQQLIAAKTEPDQLSLLQGYHERFWHATFHEMMKVASAYSRGGTF